VPLSNLLLHFDTVRRYSTIARWVDNVRLYVFELLLPLGLGALAMWRLHTYVLPFVNAVFTTP